MGMEGRAEDDYVGIGGWLLLPAIIQPLFGAGYAISGAFETFQSYQDHLPVETQVFILVLSGGCLAIAAGWLGALYLACKWSPFFPRFYIALTAIALLFPVVALMYSNAHYGTKATPRDMGDIGQSIFSALIWIPYMLVSKRVKATFSPNMIAEKDDAGKAGQALGSGAWYLARDNQTLGPLAYPDMIAELGRSAQPLNHYVWHNSFDDWRLAGDVSDIVDRLRAATNVGRQSLPPPLPRQAAAPGKRSGWSIAGTILIVVISSALARHVFSTPRVDPSVDAASTISGEAKTAFIKGGMDTCLKKQEEDPETKAANFSRATLVSYCSCYMENLAQSITHQDLRSEKPQEFLNSSVTQRKMELASAACVKELQKRLMGG